MKTKKNPLDNPKRKIYIIEGVAWKKRRRGLETKQKE